MTQAEIAAKYGITQSAVSLWKKQGCDLDDPVAVAKFADLKATRSRGITKKRKLAHMDTADTKLPDPTILSPEHRATLTESAADAFIELPAPFDGPEPLQALAILMDIEDGFRRRLDDIKTIGHALSIDLAEDDLSRASRLANDLQALLGGFAP